MFVSDTQNNKVQILNQEVALIMFYFLYDTFTLTILIPHFITIKKIYLFLDPIEIKY